MQCLCSCIWQRIAYQQRISILPLLYRKRKQLHQKYRLRGYQIVSILCFLLNIVICFICQCRRGMCLAAQQTIPYFIDQSVVIRDTLCIQHGHKRLKTVCDLSLTGILQCFDICACGENGTVNPMILRREQFMLMAF